MHGRSVVLVHACPDRARSAIDCRHAQNQLGVLARGSRQRATSTLTAAYRFARAALATTAFGGARDNLRAVGGIGAARRGRARRRD